MITHLCLRSGDEISVFYGSFGIWRYILGVVTMVKGIFKPEKTLPDTVRTGTTEQTSGAPWNQRIQGVLGHPRRVVIVRRALAPYRPARTFRITNLGVAN